MLVSYVKYANEYTKYDTKFCIEFGNIPLNSCSFMYHHGIFQSYVFCN